MDVLAAQNVAEPLDTKESVAAYRARLRRIEEFAPGRAPAPAPAKPAAAVGGITMEQADEDIRARIAGAARPSFPADCSDQLDDARRRCDSELDAYTELIEKLSRELATLKQR